MTALAQLFPSTGLLQLPLQRLQNDFGRFLQVRSVLQNIAGAALSPDDRNAAAQLLQTQDGLETQVPDFLNAVDRLQARGFEIGGTVTVTKFAAQMEAQLSSVDALVARAGVAPTVGGGFHIPLTWPWLVGYALVAWKILFR